GVFLVIESKEHAQARGAKPFARLTHVVADHARRSTPGNITAVLDGLWAKLGAKADAPILTSATGAAQATDEERAFLKKHAGAPVRALGTSFG
ncbi:hypothetical protein ABK046_46235, partial [Streptomyces caeruleatus]